MGLLGGWSPLQFVAEVISGAWGPPGDWVLLGAVGPVPAVCAEAASGTWSPQWV